MDIEMRALEGFRRGGGGSKTRHTPSSAAAAAAWAAGEEAKSRSVQRTAPVPAAAATLNTQSLSEASNRRVGKEAPPPPPFPDATAADAATTATATTATATDQLPRDSSGDRLVEQTLFRSVVALGHNFFFCIFFAL